VRIGSEEWLVGEVLGQRGEAVVLEPAELRPVIARRAKELAQELGVTRMRVSA
jgi:predicted DNA-binding transcriptional regulator YafY